MEKKKKKTSCLEVPGGGKLLFSPINGGGQPRFAFGQRGGGGGSCHA